MSCLIERELSKELVLLNDIVRKNWDNIVNCYLGLVVLLII